MSASLAGSSICESETRTGQDLLVELHVLLELRHDGAHQRLGLAGLGLALVQELGLDLEAGLSTKLLMRARRSVALHSTLTVPSDLRSWSTLDTVPTR